MLKRRLVLFLLLVLPGAVLSRWWCGRWAQECFDGEGAFRRELAAEVAAWTLAERAVAFDTGSGIGWRSSPSPRAPRLIATPFDVR